MILECVKYRVLYYNQTVKEVLDCIDHVLGGGVCEGRGGGRRVEVLTALQEGREVLVLGQCHEVLVIILGTLLGGLG